MRHDDDALHPGWPEAEDPDCDVAPFVQEGLDRARQHMVTKLQEDEVRFCEYAAAVILDTRQRVMVDDGFAAFVHNDVQAPAWATPEMTQTLAELAADGKVDLLRDSWLRYATELELTKESVGRASLAWERFALLVPRLSRTALSPAARQYVAEVVHTFLFGFDVACIALCRATFEQVAKQVVEGSVGKAELGRGATQLVVHLTRLGLLRNTKQQAESLVKKGNQVLHRSSELPVQILPQQALDSIVALTAVLGELLSTEG